MQEISVTIRTAENFSLRDTNFFSPVLVKLINLIPLSPHGADKLGA